MEENCLVYLSQWPAMQSEHAVTLAQDTIFTLHISPMIFILFYLFIFFASMFLILHFLAAVAIRLHRIRNYIS